MEYFKFVCMSSLLLPLCITICITVRKNFDISLVAESLIQSKKCFLIQQNKNYSCICKSTIITSPITFNIALTNIDAMLKQRCINIVPTLRNVVSTLFKRWALQLYERCAKLKILGTSHMMLFFSFLQVGDVCSLKLIYLVKQW